MNMVIEKKKQTKRSKSKRHPKPRSGDEVDRLIELLVLALLGFKFLRKNPEVIEGGIDLVQTMAKGEQVKAAEEKLDDK